MKCRSTFVVFEEQFAQFHGFASNLLQTTTEFNVRNTIPQMLHLEASFLK